MKRIPTTFYGAGVMLEQLANTLEAAIREAETECLRLAKEEAEHFSSGPYKAAQLRAMGHPYGWGRTPPADPAVLNKQTGRFFQAWRIRLPEKSLEGLSGALINDTPYASYFPSGTERMIPRPILAHLETLMPRVFERVLAKHLGNWVKSL